MLRGRAPAHLQPRADEPVFEADRCDSADVGDVTCTGCGSPRVADFGGDRAGSNEALLAKAAGGQACWAPIGLRADTDRWRGRSCWSYPTDLAHHALRTSAAIERARTRHCWPRRPEAKPAGHQSRWRQFDDHQRRSTAERHRDSIVRREIAPSSAPWSPPKWTRRCCPVWWCPPRTRPLVGGNSMTTNGVPQPNVTVIRSSDGR